MRFLYKTAIIFFSFADDGHRKVAVFLEELGLPYETVYLDMDKKEQKAPDYLKFNPNGRIPALVDHKNNDFVLWFVHFTHAPLPSPS